MPKSGSVYIQKALAKILCCSIVNLGNRYALIDQIGVEDAKLLVGGGCLTQNHLAPSAENVRILQHFKLKIVLHLRDPRQALLSWVYHTDRVTGGSAASESLLYFAHRPPARYFELPLARKIDWQIDNYLTELVAWVTRWVALADAGTIPVLITEQEKLRTDEKAFFESILRFYGLKANYAPPNLPRTIEDTHFRMADPSEWQRSFTLDQQARATSLIPPSLQKRFGWGNPKESAAALQKIA
jgi:hypothetical protein